MSGLTRKCEVAVVGLGPAGAMAALRLAQSGVDVVGFDRAQFPRYKVCGGCLNARSLDALRAAGLEPTALGGVPITRFEASFKRRRVSLPLPEGLAVSRTRLDAFLADKAAVSGVKTLFGTKCTALERVDDVWKLVLERNGAFETLSARFVIAADGLNGIAAKCCAGFHQTTHRSSRIGAGALLGASKAYESGTIYMAVGARGYVGLTVVENAQINVAAAFEPAFIRECGSPARAASSILDSCGFAVPTDLHEAAWRGTPPLTQQTRPVAANGLFLVGDAAGYVEPFTGEGMAWALEGASKLAEVLAKRLAGRTADAESEWKMTYRRSFSPAQRRCSWISKGLRSAAVTATVAGALGALPALATPIIHELNAAAE